jgi:LmbE family N-acetylglucosaminyl deacetylase
MSQQPEHHEDELKTFMWVVAHPDDAEFSSAGTIARFAKEGKHVVIVQVTSGNMGTTDRDISSDELAKKREGEETEAAHRLGVNDIEFLRVIDGTVMPDLSLREKITRMIRKYKPDVVVTHDPFRPYAFHPDHRGVGLATHDSVYPTARDHLYFPEHLASGLEPHKTKEIWYFGAEQPDLYVDITATFDDKINALQAHASQVGGRDDLEKMLRERSKEVAKDQPFELAEAYKTVKMRR